LNEIKILQQIKHKNIIHFESIKHTVHNYYIITEFCNGGGLSDCLKKYQTIYGRAFPEEVVQHLMRQIVDGIKYLHGLRIIHRDIKLDNILVCFNNEN
jgi:serine/threonine protein kinase